MRWARANGRRAKRWGIVAGLFMYMLVFWDHIPTVLLHKYYCTTKAGFWVYKTPEQWKAENPGVAETLTWQSNPPRYEAPSVTRAYRLNERFVWGTREEQTPILPVRLTYEFILDIKANEIVVQRIYVSSGYGSFALGGKDWRVLKDWVKSEPCMPNMMDFSHYESAFQRLGKEKK
jgi:hypothetical protein